jgi:uncharacterized protein (TIGR02757 family)
MIDNQSNKPQPTRSVEATPHRPASAAGNNAVTVDADIRQLLNDAARRINSPDFIGADPVQFPRRFSRLEDIEIVSLLSATIAWGNRKMICNNCEKMLRLMDYQPHAYVMDEGYEELPDGNIHRTFFARDLRYYLRGLHAIYSRYGSLKAFAAAQGVQRSEAPSWSLVEAMNGQLLAANGNVANSRCLPQNLQSTALKRINMALRWLVRNDGIVDMGVWSDLLTPAQLFIPLDVHVGNTARDLGLITRRANDRCTVMELTAVLRSLRPDDPVVYDYALFGLGVNPDWAL